MKYWSQGQVNHWLTLPAVGTSCWPCQLLAGLLLVVGCFLPTAGRFPIGCWRLSHHLRPAPTSCCRLSCWPLSDFSPVAGSFRWLLACSPPAAGFTAADCCRPWAGLVSLAACHHHAKRAHASCIHTQEDVAFFFLAATKSCIVSGPLV